MRNGPLRTTFGLTALLALILMSSLAAASSPAATLPVSVDASREPVRILNGTASLMISARAEEPMMVNFQLGMLTLDDVREPPAMPAMEAPVGRAYYAHGDGMPVAMPPRSLAPVELEVTHRFDTVWQDELPRLHGYEVNLENHSLRLQGEGPGAWGAVAVARLEAGRADFVKLEMRTPADFRGDEGPGERFHYFVKVWSTDSSNALVVPVGQRYEPQHMAAPETANLAFAKDQLTVLCAGIAVASGAAAGWKWLRSREWALPLPWPLLWLFTRLQRSRLLDQPTRRQVHDLIEANPGIRFADVRRQTKLAAGVVTHHLRMLEDHGLVRSIVRGRQRHLYAKGTPVDAQDAGLTEQQRAILSLLRDGALSQREIAQRLGVSQQTVSYHARRLQAFGFGVPTVQAVATPTAAGRPANPWAPRLQLGG